MTSSTSDYLAHKSMTPSEMLVFINQEYYSRAGWVRQLLASKEIRAARKYLEKLERENPHANVLNYRYFWPLVYELLSCLMRFKRINDRYNSLKFFNAADYMDPIIKDLCAVNRSISSTCRETIDLATSWTLHQVLIYGKRTNKENYTDLSTELLNAKYNRALSDALAFFSNSSISSGWVYASRKLESKHWDCIEESKNPLVVLRFLGSINDNSSHSLFTQKETEIIETPELFTLLAQLNTKQIDALLSEITDSDKTQTVINNIIARYRRNLTSYGCNLTFGL